MRDLLLGITPKDFDVATDAHPDKVRRLFRNSRLIGRRFRLVHVFFGPEIIEVATFRGPHDETAHPEAHRAESGMILRDNVYGTMEDDAWRRDFSINALYYNIADFSVVDFTGGMADIHKRVIRVLGDPMARYQEDPVRMLRAVRLAAKLDFTLHPDTEKPIGELSGLLQNVPPVRLFDEILKLFYCGKAMVAFDLLRRHGLFAVLLPQTEAALTGFHQQQAFALITQGFKNTDSRVAQGQSLNPAFLFAVLLWWPLQNRKHHHEEQGLKPFPALHTAMHEVIKHQLQHISIPRRFTTMMQEIWILQYQLQQRRGKRVYHSLSHPRFRAAYDFLLLRAEAGENLQEIVDWWRDFQEVSPEDRQKMVHVLERHKNKKRRSR